MDLRMSRERLSRTIRLHAESGFEARQVAKRLIQLLPSRLLTLKNRFSKRYNKRALSERYALISDEYIDHLDEIAEIHHQAMSARIQYETHIMLFNARQTLNRMRMP
jgi:diaminopimelate decarboxylase